MSDQGFRDVSTIVSILPYPVILENSTVVPSRYLLDEPEHGKFSFVHVVRARTDRYVGGPQNNGVVSLPILSEDLAESFVKDHIRASICVVPTVAEPGIFFLPNKVESSEISKSPELTKAKIKQSQWFIKLVEQADSDWKRTGNTRAVGMLARKAAKILNITKPWSTEEIVEQSQVEKCPVCTALVNPAAIICMTCKYILRPEEYKKISKDFALTQ